MLDAKRARKILCRAGLALVDAALIAISLLVAVWLRFDDKSLKWIMQYYVNGQLLHLFAFSAASAALLYPMSMYRRAWLYAGLEAVQSLLLASFIWTAALVLSQGLVLGQSLPRSVLLTFWLISTLLTGGLRLGIRVAARYWQNRTLRSGKVINRRRIRALIVGDAEHAAGIIRAIRCTSRLKHYQVIGILDDRIDRRGTVYSGIKVIGSSKILNRLVQSGSADEVIFTLSNQCDGSDVHQQVLGCRKHRVQAKIVPNYAESILNPSMFRLEDIRVEDLLHRPMWSADVGSYARSLRGKRVLVTGAGGSIGSEICRQIMSAKPESMILLGHGENSIFRIQKELSHSYPDYSDKIFAIIASITCEERIDRIFKKFRPQVVFNAAAHKHLPLMEYNVCEAIYNNVIGAYIVVRTCARNGVERLVQISTDKAANPSSVMGATKCLCEYLIKAASSRYLGTDFICVRFGNVLGSRGSVVPLFAAQIKNGGPVTVTHPEMTRYFITIPEAVRLVIQAGAVGQSGEVYILDMGTPVKILDLAEEVIRLNGFEPRVDIPIVFTGMRPGERMHEQLAGEDEQIESTEYRGLNRVESDSVYLWHEIENLVVKLRHMAADMDGEGILAAFDEYIPSYSNTVRSAFINMVLE